MLKRNCGLEISFLLPAIDVRDNTGYRLKKKRDLILWYDLCELEKLTHFCYIKKFHIFIHDRMSILPRTELLSRPLDLINQMLTDENIHQFMPQEDIEKYRKDILRGYRIGCDFKKSKFDYFYKYIAAVDAMAEKTNIAEEAAEDFKAVAAIAEAA